MDVHTNQLYSVNSRSQPYQCLDVHINCTNTAFYFNTTNCNDAIFFTTVSCLGISFHKRLTGTPNIHTLWSCVTYGIWEETLQSASYELLVRIYVKHGVPITLSHKTHVLRVYLTFTNFNFLSSSNKRAFRNHMGYSKIASSECVHVNPVANSVEKSCTILKHDQQSLI